MSKSFWDDLITAGSIIGGAWIAAEIIKAFSKKVTIYRCPRCYVVINKNAARCHNCGACLNW